jgi:histidine triad (HIT) family protein
MTTDPTCVFCRIVAGEAPAALVHEDDVVIAFMDIDPVAPGHLLVAPREHHPDLATVPGSIVSHMMLIAQWLAAALRASPVRTEGINLFYADGAVAGQEIFHSHLHVIPRWKGDGFCVDATLGSDPSLQELEEVAASIQAAAVD